MNRAGYAGRDILSAPADLPESSAGGYVTAEGVDPNMSAQQVLIVGQGYVGLPLAMRAVAAGFDVTGLDLDEQKIKRLSAGESYIEDIPNTRLRAALDSGRYRATAAIDEVLRFDVAVISVPTPLKEGIPDLRFMEDAAHALAPKLTNGSTVVLESTTYRGTTDELVAPILEAGSGLTAGVDFHLGYSPERIDPGNPTWTLENTPKVVSGINAASLAKVKAFFDQIVDTTVPISSTREAKLQVAREHVPPRQHRLGQRAGDVRQRPGHRRVGSHRRRRQQALRLHEVHARPRPRRRRPLPACRPELPVVAGQAQPGHELPVR